MRFKKKSWIWKLTFPFAHNNYTTIWSTIYGPTEPPPSVWRHEEIHFAQQKRWTKLGLPLWLWLYLVGFPLGLPILWNPWRWRWEWEAYRTGSGYRPEETRRILRSIFYGWLVFHRRGS